MCGIAAGPRRSCNRLFVWTLDHADGEAVKGAGRDLKLIGQCSDKMEYMSHEAEKNSSRHDRARNVLYKL